MGGALGHIYSNSVLRAGSSLFPTDSLKPPRWSSPSGKPAPVLGCPHGILYNLPYPLSPTLQTLSAVLSLPHPAGTELLLSGPPRSFLPQPEQSHHSSASSPRELASALTTRWPSLSFLPFISDVGAPKIAHNTQMPSDEWQTKMDHFYLSAGLVPVNTAQDATSSQSTCWLIFRLPLPDYSMSNFMMPHS